MIGDTRATALPRWVLVAACALALAYAAMKVVLAAQGEAGLAGFPPPTTPQDQIVARQLGNAAFVAARRWPRPVTILLRVALRGVAAATLLGAGVVVARVTRLTAAFGPPPQGAAGLVVAGLRRRLGGCVADPGVARHAPSHGDHPHRFA